MSLGIAPNTTNTVFCNPLNPNKKPSAKYANFLKFPTQNYSCSFKTKALVAERSFYQLLEISGEGSYDEIKKAYKQLARKYHPDVSPPDRTEEYTRRFIEVQEAYETLSDPSLRAIYDRDLAREMHLAFSSRRRCEEEFEEKWQWKNKWQDQMAGLKKRSTESYNNSEENMSWGARMRAQRARAAASS